MNVILLLLTITPFFAAWLMLDKLADRGDLPIEDIQDYQKEQQVWF